MRAHHLAGILQAAGIPVHVEDDVLADEFAVSQRVMGLQPIRVLVPKERVDDAEEAVLATSQFLPEFDDPAFAEDPADDAALDEMDGRAELSAPILLAVFVGVPLAVFLAWYLFGGGS